MKKLTMNLGQASYDINIGKGLLREAHKYFNLERKVLIVTDEGVPSDYSKTIAAQCKKAMTVVVSEGEGSKSFNGLQKVLEAMSKSGMGRRDCAVAVGGGVVGDLTGFAASCYMRGIDFYNVPTTVLSQVDSSIGGKTAINFDGIKNNIGAFHQPSGVLIDTDTLSTLPKRQISNGLCEALKMSVTSDKALFEKFESMSYDELLEDIEQIIVDSLSIKKRVVEEDEREAGLRKILNFGHTFGHGVEAECEMSGIYHGECVAIGMLPMCSENVRKRLVPVLKKLGLPTAFPGNADRALSFVTHDKKCSDGMVDCIYVSNIGDCEIRRISVEDFGKAVREVIK